MELIKPVSLMTPESWEVREAFGNFNRNETYNGSKSFPKPYIMTIDFMVKLQQYRELAGKSTTIHNTHEITGHSPNSMHKQRVCCVCDGHTTGLSLVEECQLLIAVGFDGIGAYPFWKSKGFHCDMRSIFGKDSVYWIEDEGKTGNYRYFSNSDEFITELSKIDEANKTI